MNHFNIRLSQAVVKDRIQCETRRLLAELATCDLKNREQIEKILRQLKQEKPAFLLGTTEWGYPVELPLSRLLTHSLIVGTTGAGKSCLALLFLNDTLNKINSKNFYPMGILDAKGELANKAVQYILAHAYRMNDKKRLQLNEKVYIIDFSQTDMVAPYNILYCQNMPKELLVNNRIETISQIYRGPSALTTRMKSILKYFMLLFIEQNIPITLFDQIAEDHALIKQLVHRSTNEQLRFYFTTRYPKEPRSTILGLRQRIDSLFLSKGVRSSLSAQSAPNFQELMDKGYLIIINVAGPFISRTTSEFLLRIILSDIQQSVFRRLQPDKKYLWCLDEAQVLYKDTTSRENMNDLLTMARSFGTHFMLMTQSLTSAVRDTDIINSILANIQWVFLFRSTLRDAKIIAPAIPVTGNQKTPKKHLYDQQKLLTKEQELKMRLEEVTYFPLQVGYLWLKSQLPRAIKMKTNHLPSPEEVSGCSADELRNFGKKYPISNLITRSDIEQQLKDIGQRLQSYKNRSHETGTKQENQHQQAESNDILTVLEKSYARKKGK